MSQSPNPASRQRARRTIETVVVLAAMFAICAGVVYFGNPFRVMDGDGLEPRARSEINFLSQAVEAFKKHFNVDYVPSNFDLSDPGPKERAYLARCWPRINEGATLNSGNWPKAKLQGGQCL